MNATPPYPSRSLRLFAAAVKWSLWLLLAVSLLLSLAWAGLHAFIVPRIGDLRPTVEIRASRVLGVPVRIRDITARSDGLIPSFTLHDVVLLDPQGREALRLPLVEGALSPRSLWNFGFEQLYIDQPHLDIRRAADGRIFVAGLDFSRSSENDGRAADWFFRQAEFVIRGGRIQWTDEMRGAPPLALSQVDFVSRNRGRRHLLRLDATPPAEWGQRFTVSGVFRQPLLSASPGRWQDWTGEVYADFAAVDVSRLRHHATLAAVDVEKGRGRLRAWADVQRGQFAGGTADVVLHDVRATLGPQLEPLALQSLSGRLAGQRLAGGYTFRTEDLQFVTEEGQRWPGGNVSVTWTGAEGQRPPQGELKADKLDLGALGQIASRLPLGTATHSALKTYAPQGLVDTVQAHWQGPLDGLTKYEARGRASRLEIAARPDPAGDAGTPGVRGAMLDFEFTQDGGKARLEVQGGGLDFPGVFEDPLLPLDSLAADVQWQVKGQQLAVSVDNLKFSNPDAQGEGKASWRTSDPAKAPGKSRFPGTLDLQASISRADGSRVWRYLPLGVPKEARDYVRGSVLTGTATGARFRVKGDLHDFPFADGRGGEFLVTTDVRDVTYAYVPRSLHEGPGTWPALTGLSGELRFEGAGMQVKGATGRFSSGPRLQVKADAQIPDFRRTQVRVQGKVRGAVTDSLAIVNASPVTGMLNQALARTTATGNADVDLELVLPIGDFARSQVQGTVTLANNDVQITPDSPLLARSRGAVLFSDKGFQLAGVQARALGGDVRLEGGTRAGAAGEGTIVQLRGQGTVSADGLRQARELGFVSRLARDFTGTAAYNLVLTFRHGLPELLVTSNLQGLGVNLPAPLNKPPEGVLPLRYETALTRESLANGARPQETLSVEIGRMASVSFLRDVSGAEPHVLRGAIAVGLAPGESVVLPPAGVSANVQLASLNVDAWQDALERVAGQPSPVPAGPPARSATEAGPSASYLPTLIAIRAKELNAEGRTLHNVVVGGSRDGRMWRANVDADELNGYVEYRQPQSTGAGRLYARLARLRIADAEADDFESLLEQQPSSIPALDIIVDDFELKGRRLGRMEIDAVNRGPGTVVREGGIREWRLNKLSLTMPEATFNASGNWAEVGAQAVAPGGPRREARPGERRRTAMKFRLDIADAGQVLARFGMKDIVRRGRGAMEGTVAWVGSPLALDYPSMNGSFNVNVEGGQFLKADPGLAKLLGVLSLQSLPRRLALDFRDVFSEGFSFDFVRGDITIDQGIASTNNLQMKGVNAAVLMEGKADIARETQDLKVVVVPEINAGTASLVATAINPAIGLASFLAQIFLRQPLIKAATQEFHVDGTWTDPRVTRVGRAPAAPREATGDARSQESVTR